MFEMITKLESILVSLIASKQNASKTKSNTTKSKKNELISKISVYNLTGYANINRVIKLSSGWKLLTTLPWNLDDIYIYLK